MFKIISNYFYNLTPLRARWHSMLVGESHFYSLYTVIN